MESYIQTMMKEQTKLEFTKAKLFLDYLSVLWNSPLNKSFNNVIHLSFYGGEPLLNVPFIEKVIGYTKGLKNQVRKFAYSMTTNGMLLDKIWISSFNDLVY